VIQRGGGFAMQAAGEAAVQAQRQDFGAAMRRLARADIGKTLQQAGAHQVEVAQDGGMGGQVLGDMAQLAAVQQLAMAEMDVGDGDAVETDNLADALHHGAAGQCQHARRREFARAPHRQAMAAAGQGRAEIMAAEIVRQRVHFPCRFLKQEQIGVPMAGEAEHVTQRGALLMQKIPADNLGHARGPVPWNAALHLHEIVNDR